MRWHEGWRNAGDFNFATNAHVSNFYNKFGKTWEYKKKWFPLINKLLAEGKTITLGLDFYAETICKRGELPQWIWNTYSTRINKGEVIKLSINSKEIKEY